MKNSVRFLRFIVLIITSLLRNKKKYCIFAAPKDNWQRRGATNERKAKGRAHLVYLWRVEECQCAVLDPFL